MLSNQCLEGKKNTGHSFEGIFVTIFPFLQFKVHTWLLWKWKCYKSENVIKGENPCLLKIKVLTFNVTIAKMI